MLTLSIISSSPWTNTFLILLLESSPFPGTTCIVLATRMRVSFGKSWRVSFFCQQPKQVYLLHKQQKNFLWLGFGRKALRYL